MSHQQRTTQLITIFGYGPTGEATADVLRARGTPVRVVQRKRPANLPAGEAQTITVSGSLQVVLERILRNWNHMIVRSPDNKSGIAKVTILNSTYGAGPAKATVGASGESNDKMLQALTGEGIE